MSLMSNLKQAIPEPVRSLLGHIVRRFSDSGGNDPQNTGASGFPVPHHLSANHRNADETALAELRRSIERNYHVGWRSREAYSDDGYEKDIHAHLLGRLEQDRKVVVPWLDTVRPLNGLKILEIGCGTGSSTVALAEQGAAVAGIDIDEGALQVARDRCRVYGVAADIRVMDATRLEREFEHGEFDFIIFFACLEHMTISERLSALSQAWSILPADGLLGVIDTPNRLWFHDRHTSLLPFFQWLPDELAFQYSRFSPRENFREIYRERTDVSFEHFIRRGRGISFHEFDLAIEPVGSLGIAGSLSAFLEHSGLLKQNEAHRTYANFLRQQCPQIPAPFFERDLNLVIRKSMHST